MKRLWTIARHEFRGFFDHPTAYILVIAFLGLGLFLAFRSIYAQSLASLRPFFDLLPILFAIFIPAVTMRSLAEERRGKTLEWLVAQPLSEIDVLLGKFVGNLLFVLVALACTLPMAVGVAWVSEADAGIMIAQYVGSALLGALFVAVGLWASSVTRNQITAFILGTTVSVALVLIGAPVVQIGLPPRLAAIVGQLSVVGHFSNVARGVIDLRDVVYFLSATAVFLALSGFWIARDRLSPGRSTYRRLRLGTGLTVALAIVASLVGSFLRGRIDLTDGNLYTLADGTRDLLRGLDDLVTVKFYASRELPIEVNASLRDVRDLLADFRRQSNGTVRVEELDPDRDESVAEEARSFGIQPLDFNVLREDEFQVRRGWFGLAVQYADESEVIPIVNRTSDLELTLAEAISNMTRERTPTLAWMTGFGARSSFEFQAARAALAERYTIRDLDLTPDSAGTVSAIDSVDAVVVPAPTEPVDPAAIDAIRAYMARGGGVLFMLETTALSPQAPATIPVSSGFEGLIEERGVRIEAGVAYDLQSSERISMGQQGIFSVVRAYPYWPVALPASDHPAARDLTNLTFGWPSPLSIVDTAAAIPLWTTTEAGGLQAPGGSIAPEIPPASATSGELSAQVLAVAVEDESGEDEQDPGRGGRMVVVGDANLLEDQFVRANPQNLVFVANAIDWLAQDEILIGIRSKDRTPPPLIFESEAGKNILKWGCLVGIPLMLAIVGLLRVRGREVRARRKWEGVLA